MAQDGRRQIDHVRTCIACGAGGEAGTINHQKWRLLVGAEATVLAAAEAVGLVPAWFGGERTTGDAVLVLACIRRERDREGEPVVRRLADAAEFVGVDQPADPAFCG